MPSGKRTVALVYGGRSAEHEVSLRSAASVFSALNRDRYDVVPIFITKEGAWYRRPADDSSFRPEPVLSESERLIFSPDPAHGGFLRIGDAMQVQPLAVDVVFPVLHGTYGEDGTIQGVLEMANLPYVGCGVLASAAGMDKVLMKGAFRDNGLTVGPFFWFLRTEWKNNRSLVLERLKASRFPVFVKPANLGSSVGITKVNDPSGFPRAVEMAASYDRKILVEDGISGRELEVGVLGNDIARASVAGEIISHSDFYDYEEKYLQDTAELLIPADLSPDELVKAQSVALAAFRAVDGSGLSRVDMFLTPKNQVIVNEINTLPGFTSISMYPKLWEESGISYSDLVETLIELAFERHQEKQSTLTDRARP